MTKKVILTVAFTWLTTSGAFAAGWTLVDNMEYADTPALLNTWKPTLLDTPDDGTGGGAVSAVDPGDANNKVLEVDPGVAIGTTAYNQFIARSLPAGTEISGMGTLFFRVKVPNVDIGGTLVRAVADVTWGLSWRKPVADPLNPDPATEIAGSYGDYSVVARNEFDNSFDVFDQSASPTYQTVLVDGITADTWYDIWYVLDHANNQFKVYARGPQLGNGTDVTLVYPFTAGTWAAERSPSLEPLQSFLLYSSAGTAAAPKGLDPMYVDDIYVDNTGENLTSPLDADESGTVINISTRGLVGTGGDIMIGGFIITGGARTVLIRGIGPALIPAPYNIANAIPDPEIELYDSTSTVIASNDDWSSSPDAAAIEAAALKYTGFQLPNPSLDSAILINLPAGAYTVFLRGKGTENGVGLIEVYDAAD